MYQSYGVDSYHINIGTGDAAVHVLVEINYDAAGDEIAKFWVDAILVDTGYYEGHADGVTTHLNEMIDGLNSNYANKESIKVSHIVLTHWDEDHCSGLVSLFERQMTMDLSPPYNLKTKIYKPSFLNQGKINYLIGPAPPENKVLRNLQWTGDDIEYAINPEKASIQAVDTKPPQNNKNLILESTQSKFPRFLRGSEHIGQNLFNWQPVNPVTDYKTIQGPEGLIAANPPNDTHGVGMYIVAADLCVIGFDPANMPEEAANNTNNRSLAIMVIYGDNQVQPHIAHYFAGDLGEIPEKLLVAWTQTNNPHEVHTIKLSHHGATDSTPVDMLTEWKPRNVIISAGANEQYGHPRWEIILLINEYAKWAGARGFLGGKKLTLLTTLYPYYLTRGQWFARTDPLFWSEFEHLKDAKVFSMFMKDGKIPLLFRNELSPFSQGSNVKGVVDEFKEQKDDFLPRREFILGKTEQAFRELSHSLVKDRTIKWVLAESRDPDFYYETSQISFTDRFGNQKYPDFYKKKPKAHITATQDQVHTFRGLGLMAINSDTHDFQQLATREANHTFGIMATPPPLAQKAEVLHGRVRFSQFSAYGQEFWKPGTARDTIMADLCSNSHSDLGYVPAGYSMDEMDSQNRTSWRVGTNNDMPHDANIKQGIPTVTGGSFGWNGSPEAAFYLYSSDVRQLDGATNIQALTSTGSSSEKCFNEFIMALHRGVLGLQGRPAANTTVAVDLNDEWMSWMQLCLNVENISIVSDEKNLVSGLVLSLPFNQTYKTKDIALPSEDPLLIPPSAPGMEQPQPGASSSGSLGIFADRNFVVFTLDESKEGATDLTLGEVLERSNLNSAIPALQSPAMGFVKVLPLKIDTAPDARNWITFFPEANYLTVVRSQYVSTTSVFDDFLKWMGLEEKYFSIENITVITKKQCTWKLAPDGAGVYVKPELILGLTCHMKPSGVGPGYAFTGAIRIMDDILELSIVLHDGLPIAELLTWAVGALKLEAFELGDILQGAKSLKTLLPRRVAIRFGLEEDGTISGIFAVNIELTMSFQTAKNPVLTLFTYQWARGAGSTFTGNLWCRVPPTRYKMFLPDYEPILQIQAPKPEEQSTSLDLKDIFQSDIIQNVPDGLPTKIIRATISVTKDSVYVGGTIVSDIKNAGDVPMPRLQLSSVSVDLSYNWTLGDVTAEAQIRVALLPPKNSLDSPAEMGGSFRYNSGSKLWQMRGFASGLKMSNLYSLFDSTSQDAVMEVMQAITIRRVDLEYDYSGSSGSQFTASADIVLGGLLFTLTYNYAAGGLWHVQANLSTASQSADDQTTIGALIEDVTGSNGEDLAIPEFLGDIQVKKPNPSTGLLGLYCSKKPNTSKPGAPSNEGICFVVYGMIESLVFTFTQFRSTLSAAEIAAGTKDTGARKRIIKASVTSLPKLDIPLLGNLTQPFDEMYFLWVQDATKSEGVIKGLTAADVDQINAQYEAINGANPSMAGKIPKLLYKNPSSAKKDPDPTAVVIEAGWHFVLVLKDEKGQLRVVLDYVFGKNAVAKSNESVKGNKMSVSSGPKANASPNEKLESPNGPASLAPMKKNQGPLTFERIGFEFKNETLSLLLDAKIALGPLEFSLIGLKVNMNLRNVDSKGNPKPQRVTLQTLKLENFSLSLEGMAVSFDKPPIKVAGKFVSAQYGDIKYYAGGIIIGFDPWMFQAAGMYGTKTVNGREIKNVFVFLKLDGPLITLGYADISGLTGGLGYNMDLKWPSVSDITNFPFIAGGSPDTDPMKQINALTEPGGWITPVEDVMWCAVGMKVAAFKVMSVDAVVIVQWSPSVRLAIFGLATIDVPSTKAKKKFAHVELGIAATIDPGAGVMKLEAQLSPNSYILDPSCHLSGGFALYSWWTPLNPHIEVSPDNHAGDWVLTIGGYHRNFAVPPHYPQPDRLQISWSLGNTLSITGQAYFAITPKCCMGGGRLQATLSVGLLRAWFDAYVDFLVNYEPFRFIGDGGLTIGVKFTLDLWLITIHISVEISANLHIEGPPVRGYVHVDFYVFGFDIAFGAEDNDRRVDVPLGEFYDAVLQNTNGAKLSPPSAKGLNEAHTFTCVSGIIPPAGKDAPDATEPWLVKPGNLSFAVSCKLAVNEVTVLGESVPLTGVDSLYAKPMRLQTVLHSTISVEIFGEDEDATSDKPSKRASPTEPKNRWVRSTRSQPLPSALYGYYDPLQDPLSPSSKGNNVTQLLQSEGATSILTTEVQIAPPPAQPSDDKLAKFNAVEGFKQPIYSGVPIKDEKGNTAVDEKNFPDCPAVSPEWEPRSPDPDPVAQYKAIATAWSTAQESEACLAAVVDALGWRTINPSLKDLSAEPPHLLLKEFDNLSIAAPVFC